MFHRRKITFIFLFITQYTYAQFTNESELGFSAANGNTKTKSYTIQQENTYEQGKDIFRFKSRYLNASANGIETARFLKAELRYEREVSGRVSLFVGETYESDKFIGIQNRYISDLGGKYFFIESSSTKLFSEAGYRFMKEERFDNSEISRNYLRLYNEWENEWNKNFSTKYWLEILPNLSENKDYQINTELSLSAILTNYFSMKSSFLVRYDHMPAPGILYKTDTIFTTALVAKF